MIKLTNKRISIIFTGLILLAGMRCNESTSSQASVEISMNDFISAHKSDSNIKVLDVRESNEYAQGHVPKAVLAPLSALQSPSAQIEKLVPFSKDEKIYVICRSGKRSLAAVSILKGFGYSNAVSVQSGTQGWIDSGNETVK